MSSALRPLRFEAAYLDDEIALRIGLVARIRSWLVVHRISLAVLVVLLSAVALLHGWGMYSWPGIDFNDDEGTYVSQAWAVTEWHQLGHYTYWYDHPPLGWIQLSAYTWITGAWSRAPYAVAAGREFMLVVDVVAAALIYGLARRLSLSRAGAAVAVLLFAASPLGLEHHRVVWLDNIGVMWLLAALFLAASPRRSLSSGLGSAVCLAVSVLSKETLLILAPTVLYLLWASSDARTRRYRVTGFVALASLLTLFYPLYAAVKNELFEGPGHVSLVWAIRWQLFDRGSSGSVFTRGSGAANAVLSWLHTDPWLLVGGVVLALPALWIVRLRPVASGLLLQVGMLLRPGYLPAAYVVAVLPFAAIVAAGTVDHLLGSRPIRSRPVMLALALLVTVGTAGPLVRDWKAADETRLGNRDQARVAEAVAWVQQNVPQGAHMIVDDNVWLDLVRAGYSPDPADPSVVWVYKVGLDPAVKLRSVDYFVYAMDPITAALQVPAVKAPYEHSRVVATFGTGADRVVVRQVMSHKKLLLPAAPAT